MILEVADRWWVLHESAIGASLVRCYNHEIDPAEALAIMLEHSVVDTGGPDGEADHSEA